jgi:type IV secretory pathway VirB4 component
MPNQSTQQLIDVSDIREDVIIMKNGSLRSIINVSAINFELRSEEEQVAILQNFQRFLNTLDFPLQIVTQSRQLKIGGYIKLIDEKASALDELLKIQAIEYARFVKELSELANIMSKKFYVVIPFYAVESTEKGSVVSGLKNLFGSTGTSTTLTDGKFESFHNQLQQRVGLIMDGLLGMGLRADVLKEEALIKLFRNLYNPGMKISDVSD